MNFKKIKISQGALSVEQLEKDREAVQEFTDMEVAALESVLDKIITEDVFREANRSINILRNITVGASLVVASKNSLVEETITNDDAPEVLAPEVLTPEVLEPKVSPTDITEADIDMQVEKRQRYAGKETRLREAIEIAKKSTTLVQKRGAELRTDITQKEEELMEVVGKIQQGETAVDNLELELEKVLVKLVDTEAKLQEINKRIKQVRVKVTAEIDETTESTKENYKLRNDQAYLEKTRNEINRGSGNLAGISQGAKI